FRTGIEATLAAILSAPELIYLDEPAPEGAAPGEIVAVDGFALASRLSYFLWDSTPDEALLVAAESGALSTEAGVEAEVRRMLEDPRARDAIAHFIYEWTFIGDLEQARKDPIQFASYTPELGADLQASFVAGLENAFWSNDPSL